MELEFKNFEGDEDEQYAVWNKQLKKHESTAFTDEIDDLIAIEDFDPAEYDWDSYDYEEWN